MTEQKSSSEKTTTSLVEFEIGPRQASPSFLRVTDASTPQIFKGNTYLSEPSLEVELASRTGTMEDGSTKITISHDDNTINQVVRDFVMRISSARAHPPVIVRLMELVLPNTSKIPQTQTPTDAGRVYYMFKGNVIKTRRNPDGVVGKVEIDAANAKAFSAVSSGLKATQFCPAAYGGYGCWKDVTAETFELCTLSMFQSLGSFRVSIFGKDAPDNTAIKNMLKGFWRGGYIEREGLTIRIREWLQFTNDFMLSQQPPKEWQSQTVTLHPGCPGSLDDCTDRNNTDLFEGIGFAIPAYHPSFQEGS